MRCWWLSVAALRRGLSAWSHVCHVFGPCKKSSLSLKCGPYCRRRSSPCSSNDPCSFTVCPCSGVLVLDPACSYQLSLGTDIAGQLLPLLLGQLPGLWLLGQVRAPSRGLGSTSFRLWCLGDLRSVARGLLVLGQGKVLSLPRPCAQEGLGVVLGRCLEHTPLYSPPHMPCRPCCCFASRTSAGHACPEAGARRLERQQQQQGSSQCRAA